MRNRCTVLTKSLISLHSRVYNADTYTFTSKIHKCMYMYIYTVMYIVYA